MTKLCYRGCGRKGVKKRIVDRGVRTTDVTCQRCYEIEWGGVKGHPRNSSNGGRPMSMAAKKTGRQKRKGPVKSRVSKARKIKGHAMPKVSKAHKAKVLKHNKAVTRRLTIAAAKAYVGQKFAALRLEGGAISRVEGVIKSYSLVDGKLYLKGSIHGFGGIITGLAAKFILPAEMVSWKLGSLDKKRLPNTTEMEEFRDMLEKSGKRTCDNPQCEPTIYQVNLAVGEPGVAQAVKRAHAGLSETINHPDHYGGEENPYEAIKVIEACGLGSGFNKGNAIKYIMRAGKKGDSFKAADDLKKAAFYCNREAVAYEHQARLEQALKDERG